MTKKRESNFELLRILACVMVVSHHFVVKGNGIVPESSFAFSQILYMILLPWGKIGVNCFILLSGYFLSKKPAGTSRVLRLVWTVTIYSIISQLLLMFGPLDAEPLDWKAALLPIAYNTVGWFVGPFLAMTILSGAINKMLEHLEHADWVRLMFSFAGVSLLCTNVLPHSTFVVDQFVWFVFLYIIGAYLRQYPARWMQNRRLLLLLNEAAAALLFLAQAMIRVLVKGNPSKLYLSNYYAENGNSVFCLVCAVLLFLLCRSIRLQNSVVNWVAGSCFGIYLLTDCTALGTLFWSHVAELELYAQGAPRLLLGTILSVTAVFGITLVIAKAAYYILERPLFSLWQWAEVQWERFEAFVCKNWNLDKEVISNGR